MSYYSGSVLQTGDPVTHLLPTSWHPSSGPPCTPWRGIQSTRVVPPGCSMFMLLITELWIQGSLSSVLFPCPCPHYHGQDLACKAIAKQKHFHCSVICATRLCAVFTSCRNRDTAERPACLIQVLAKQRSSSSLIIRTCVFKERKTQMLMGPLAWCE